MRLTLRGAVVGGSVAVLLTTALLWLQCHPRSEPHRTTGYHYSSDGTQHRRLPLQTRQQQQHTALPQYTGVGIVGVLADEEYAWEGDADEGEGGGGPLTAPLQTRVHQGSMSEVPCVINEEVTISCRREEREVYIPFSFLHQYFEVHGSLQPSTSAPNYNNSGSNSLVSSANSGIGGEGEEVFVWQHSNSRVFEPSLPYSPHGSFLNFQLYNVESRDRVKCISAKDGVPVSTQWRSAGHTYPIQIAQFGLSHYCKLLVEGPPMRTVLEDAFDHIANWQVSGAGSRIGRLTDNVRATKVLRYRANECSVIAGKTKGGVRLLAPPNVGNDQLTLSVDWLLQGSSSLSATFNVKDKKMHTFNVHYLPSDDLLWTKSPRNIYYGVGHSTGWRRLTRNLLVDLQKGLAVMSHVPRSLKKVTRSRVQLVSLQVCGEGRLDNLTLSTAEHRQHFRAAADWLAQHQDHLGGWPIAVPRTVVKGLLQLPSGWYSAMAQGQAISLLVRAAHHTGDQSYLDAAVRATHLYTVNATQGGVRAYFPGGYAWYEEYPTTPSLFVLNGFIYSLIGLYDLKEASPGPSTTEAAELYAIGMTSLKTLLPLFDTGWGSLYDLRHFTSHVAPKPARWDYHTTHITQLLLLAALDDDPVLKDTAARWTEYLHGKRASHN